MCSHPQSRDTPMTQSTESCLQQDINKFIQGTHVNEKNAKGTNVSCAHCSTNERVQTFYDLKKGDHISLAGDNFKCNISKRQFALFRHHAIVKSVKPLNDGSEAILTLIHFNWTPFSKSIKIQETEEIKYLYNEEIYRCRYRHQTHSPKIVIERAEQLVKESKQKKYSVLTYNCEHMVHWCLIGTSKSLQVENLYSKIIKWANEVDGISKRIARLIMSLRRLEMVLDIAKLIPEDVVEIAKSNMSFFTLAGMILGFLLFSIYKHYKLSIDFDKGDICKACCARKKWELWLEFSAYLITNSGGFLLLILSTINWISGLIFTGSIILSVSSMYLAPKLWSLFKGPFLGKQNEISSLEEIQEGDIITVHHWKLKHDCIVSSMEVKKTNLGNMTKGKLKVIHFALPSLTSRRRIIEEDYDIDLTVEKVLVHDYSGYVVFPPDEVIRRARLRIGEIKFNALFNRSPHFCFWAKVNERSFIEDDIMYSSLNEIQYKEPFIKKEESENPRVVFTDHRNDKILSSCKIDTYQARTREEIQGGDLIEFKYNKLPHKAICIKVIYMEKFSELKLSVIHYGNAYTIVEEEMKFDLNKDTIEVHKHHPIHSFRREDIIKRAKAKVGETKYSIFTNRASHFASKTVLKTKDLFITSLTDLEPGDAFIYKYWGLPHEAIVVDVKTDEETISATGTIEFVHYGLENIFATRKIVVETKSFNVKQTKLQRKCFDGYYTYPKEISVMRAKSRLGELRFNSVYNKSSDFVFWCKIIQEPSVFVLKSPTKANNVDISENLVVFPHSGKVMEQFQENWIKTWSELAIGSVIKVCGKLGILENLYEASNKIGVIYYNKSKKQIESQQFNIDLKKSKERIFVYWCDPRKCYLPHNIITRAKFEFRNSKFTSDWDFCKYVVMK